MMYLRGLVLLLLCLAALANGLEVSAAALEAFIPGGFIANDRALSNHAEPSFPVGPHHAKDTLIKPKDVLMVAKKPVAKNRQQTASTGAEAPEEFMPNFFKGLTKAMGATPQPKPRPTPRPGLPKSSPLADFWNRDTPLEPVAKNRQQTASTGAEPPKDFLANLFKGPTKAKGPTPRPKPRPTPRPGRPKSLPIADLVNRDTLNEPRAKARPTRVSPPPEPSLSPEQLQQRSEQLRAAYEKRQQEEQKRRQRESKAKPAEVDQTLLKQARAMRAEFEKRQEAGARAVEKRGRTPKRGQDVDQTLLKQARAMRAEFEKRQKAEARAARKRLQEERKAEQRVLKQARAMRAEFEKRQEAGARAVKKRGQEADQRVLEPARAKRTQFEKQQEAGARAAVSPSLLKKGGGFEIPEFKFPEFLEPARAKRAEFEKRQEAGARAVEKRSRTPKRGQEADQRVLEPARAKRAQFEKQQEAGARAAVSPPLLKKGGGFEIPEFKFPEFK